MVLLVRRDGARSAGQHLPGAQLPVWSSDLTAVQGLVDQPANEQFPLGLCGKEDSKVHVAVGPSGTCVVWSNRTGRLVVPVAAEGHGNTTTRSTDVRVGRHSQNGVVSESGTHRVSVPDCLRPDPLLECLDRVRAPRQRVPGVLSSTQLGLYYIREIPGHRDNRGPPKTLARRAGLRT